MDIEYYLPARKVTNTELGQEFPDWDYIGFGKKIGISARHISSEGETALDMAERASLMLFGKIDKVKIDFVLLCTQSPDYLLPTSACILQDRLGLSTTCGALDFNLGCSGYIYGLALAKGLLASKVATNILFIVSETYSKHLHPKDKVNRAIFGDAAAATLISSDSLTIGEFVLGTDGKGFEELIIKNGGQRNRPPAVADEYDYANGNITSNDHLYMNGPAIYAFTINTIPNLVRETAERNQLSLNEIDFFIFHQANEYMLNYLRTKSQIPSEKFCIDLAVTGNTVSATIPIALKNAIAQNRVTKGSRVMLVGFGVGLSWGATIITIN
ncbi:MAG: ketoacyl-ACP synthase III [Verrucomicrobia bacterium]|nr:ketoacyl-ACP synthase III [Verrucomicrobiota bacterium]